MNNTIKMKSIIDILKEALLGKTMIGRDYDDDLKIEGKIKDIQIYEDSTIYLTIEGLTKDVRVFADEGIILKEI